MAGVHPARAYRFARPMHPYSDSPSGVQLARADHSSGNDSHSPASRKNGDGLRRHPFCPEAVVCPHPSLHQNIEYGQIELLWS